MIKTFENITKEEIADVVDEVVQHLKPGSLVFLDGDPGAGKTFLVSQIMWRFDISEVASPTFALHHRYQNNEVLFHHFDLYRVENEDELETVGLWDLLSEDPTALFLIEWASKFPVEIWPMEAAKIRIQISNYSESSRNYKISFEGQSAE